MKIILRTHGGLGNQLFQVLFSRLFSERYHATLVSIHETRYKHKFQMVSELKINNEPLNSLERLFSLLRLPKILYRFGLNKSEIVSLFGNSYLDGYFQDVSCFNIFDDKSITRELELLRYELKIDSQPKSGTLVHFRLGDFFVDNDSAIKHVNERIKNVEDGSVLITNKEEIFELSEIKETLKRKLCTLHSTKDFDAIEVLRLMASYEKIEANDSTMVFWASVLGGAEADFTHPPLAKLLTFLKTRNAPTKA